MHQVALDQRDEESIEAAVANVLGTFDRCDILVNNAAWNIGIPFRQMRPLDADDVGPGARDQPARPVPAVPSAGRAPPAGDGGRIVNIASVGGLNPGSSSIAYSCSKAGLIHLTHCLAVALAPEISVNCVAPGLVEGTRMALRLPDEVVRRRPPPGRARQGRQRRGHRRRDGDAVPADTITGQTIVVDGGMPGAMNFG